MIPKSSYPKNVEQKAAVIRHNGAATFADDGRVRHFGIVTNILNVIHHIVCILFQRIVHTRFKIGLRAIVVNAQPAANIQVLQPGAAFLHLRIHPGGFNHCLLDLANIGDLAA